MQRPMMHAVQFAVLGPLRVTSNEGPIEIAGAKERTLLAHLVARCGRLVSADELVDALWGDAPPRSAVKSLQTYVLRLRNALEPERRGTPRLLVTDGGGYRLAVPDDAVDAHRFCTLVDLGRRAYREGRADAAARTLREAQGLWRGPAYAGFELTLFGRAEASRLEELRLVALEDRIAADMDLGRARDAVPELEGLVRDHPLRERLWVLLMLALHRSGRHAEALAAYERARMVLAEELGIDPGEELRHLHAHVLVGDPELSVRAVPAALPAALVPPPGPLVGRERELAVLRDAWGRAAARQTITVVLRGRRGSGARRLTAEFAAEVAELGGRVEHRHGGTLPSGPAEVPTLSVITGCSGLVRSVTASGPRLLVVIGATVASPGAQVIDLQPLAAGEVRAILSAYLPPPAVDEALPAVLRESGGLPARVHDAAVRLARERAVARVGDAAARTGEMQRALAEARDDLRRGVTDLRDAVDRERPLAVDACPWIGLAVYDVADADWFAGRERLIAELLVRLASARLIAVVGASGSGKSSLLRAGLLASLAAGALPGSEAWARLVMRPGPHPMRELARVALRGADPGPDHVADLLRRAVYGDGGEGRVVLVIDQFEEVWTACAEPGERTGFLDALAAIAESDVRCSIVLGVRADYVGKLADQPVLARAAADATILVGALSEAEVRRAVQHPADRAGLELDVALVDALVADAGNEPGSLPLLSTALTELWERRAGRRLTLPAYVAAGGIRGAVARIAERAYDALDTPQQAAARVLLLRLAGPGEAGMATRRRVALAELAGLPDPRVSAVVDHLAAARLLSVSEGHVEVAHEALFREWPRLRAWLDEDAVGRATQRRLALAAAEWDAGGREPTELWRGTRLEAGIDFAASHPDEVTELERAFLAAARAHLDAERRAAEERAAIAGRQNRRLRLLLAGVGLLLAAALAAGVLAAQARARAEEERVAADAQRLGATALTEDYPDRALLTAVEAVRMDSSPETLGALVTLLARAPAALAMVRTANRFLSLDCTPDASTCFAGLNRGEVWRIDGTTAQVRVMSMAPSGFASVVDVSPDGRLVAIGHQVERTVGDLDGEDGRRIDVYRVSDWHRMLRLDSSREPHRMFSAWSPDSSALLVPGEHHLLVIDTGTWTVARRVQWPLAPQSMGSAAAIDADRVLVAFWSEPRQRLVDLRTGRTTHPLEAGDFTLGGTVSPDGRLLAWANRPGEVRLTDLQTWRDVRRLPVDGDAVALAFSPDGQTLASGGGAKKVQLWDVASGEFVRELTGHSGLVLGTVFAGNGRTLWTAGRDGLIVAWDLTGRRGVAVHDDLGVRTNAGMAADDGRTAVLLEPAGEDGRQHARAWDLTAHREIGTGPLIDPGNASAGAATVAITADGGTGLVVMPGPQTPQPQRGDTLLVFNLPSGEVRHRIQLPFAVLGVDPTPDSHRAVVNGGNGFMVVDLHTGRSVSRPHPLPQAAPVDLRAGVAVSPNGRLAALARGNRVHIVELQSGRSVSSWQVDDDDQTMALAWSPDSRVLVHAGLRGRVWFRSAPEGEAIEPGRLLHAGFVLDLEVSPNGRWLASIGTDGEIVLWDLDERRPLGRALVARSEPAWGWLAWSPDGRALRVSYETGTVVTYEVDPQAWIARACRIARRDLNTEEWRLLRPGVPWQPTCSTALRPSLDATTKRADR